MSRAEDPRGGAGFKDFGFIILLFMVVCDTLIVVGFAEALAYTKRLQQQHQVFRYGLYFPCLPRRLVRE